MEKKRPSKHQNYLFTLKKKKNKIKYYIFDEKKNINSENENYPESK